MENMSSLTKCIILIVVVLVLLYLLQNTRRNVRESFTNINKTPQAQNLAEEEKLLEEEYKQSSYAGGRRGDRTISDLDKFFDDRMAVEPENANDNYTPYDEEHGSLAPYKNSSKATDEDIYNLDNYLPKEQMKTWFDVPPEAIPIKDRHLINVTRPIGVTTNASARRNASQDLRGTPVCPKYVVSPWMNSSIDPDDNINRGKLC
jgi:hypothetical protein